MMVWTAQVALASVAVRSVAGPVESGRTSLGWFAVTMVLAGSVFLPIGRAVSAMMLPRDIGDEPRCPRCARAELRPLRTGGRGIFDAVQRYRCGACWTSFDRAEGGLVERSQPEPAGSPGIWYVEAAGSGSTGAGIEFLGEVEPAPRTSTAGPCPRVMPREVPSGEPPEATRR